jgi:hypothetical protein
MSPNGKSLRPYLERELFELYDGDKWQGDEYPELSLDAGWGVLGRANIYYDLPSARLVMNRKHDVLRVEFWDSKVLQSFVDYTKVHFPYVNFHEVCIGSKLACS